MLVAGQVASNPPRCIELKGLCNTGGMTPRIHDIRLYVMRSSQKGRIFIMEKFTYLIHSTAASVERERRN